MSQQKNKWNGKRAVIVCRQSDDKDGTGSTKAQLEHMSKVILPVGMNPVGHVALEGVSAASPARIAEIIQKLFDRKKKHNDFDVIVWQLEDRATRGGGEFGMWLEHEAKLHGLLVYFEGDENRPKEYGAAIRVMKYEAAKQGSIGTGQRATQGHDKAKKDGFYRTSGHTPIGCDRLYLGADDKPKFIIHNLPSGLQEQIDYATRVVIATYGTIGKKSRNRFKKQRNEYSLLMPGDEKQMRVVRVIFYLRYAWGWRGCRIADFLNRNGIPSPKGKQWSQRQVEIIYENESYTGVSYNNQTYSGRFFRRDKVLGFVALDRDDCELAIKKTFAPKLLPMSEWDRIDQPYMYDFLPKHIRDFAITAQAQMWAERTDPNRTPREVTPVPASDYLLSGKLRAIQDKQPLTGTISGKKGNYKPYYRHPRSKRGHLKGSIFNRLIPCLPLHISMVEELAAALSDLPDLRERLMRYLLEQRSTSHLDQPDSASLQAEREELKQQMSMIMRSLRGAALADAEVELSQMSERRNEIEASLTKLKGKFADDTRPAEQVVEEAVALLARDGQKLLKLPSEPLRVALDLLVAEAWVDMETKAVELKVNLPSWALLPKPKTPKKSKELENQPENEVSTLCPATPLWSLSDCQTHIYLTLICTYESLPGSTTRPPCYRCRRSLAA